MFILGVPTQDWVHIQELCILDPKLNPLITLFRVITMFCGTNSILRNIFHILSECEEYSAEYCQSNKIFCRIL